MKFPDLSKCKDSAKNVAKNVLIFGNKNLPSLMVGGSVGTGWLGVYMFWKESRAAEAEIREREEVVVSTQTEDDTIFEELGSSELEFKEKAIIYAKHCWPSATMGVVSTVLAIWAHKIDLSRLAEMYVLTQFLEEKSGRQEKLIDKLKGEVKESKVEKFEREILEEEYPDDDILDLIDDVPGDGTTLFIDRVTHVKFRADIMGVMDGIEDTNDKLKSKRETAIKTKGINKYRDPFFVAENSPFPSVDKILDADSEEYKSIYSSVSLSYFLKAIGEIDQDDEARLDDLLEFRYYGGGRLLKPKNILIYKQYKDPATGVPAVCYIDYTEYLSPSYELLERNPMASL